MVKRSRVMDAYTQLKGERNYWFYLLSCGLSRMGDAIDALAYSWLAYQLTGSEVWLSIIAGVNALPTIFLTPLIAPIVERMNKKTVMVVTGMIRALLVLLTGVLMMLDMLTAPILLVCTLLMSITESFSDPAYMASVPKIIPMEKLDAGIALRTTVAQTMQMAGAGIGGVLIAAWGSGGVLVADAALFLLATLAIGVLRLKTSEAGDEPKKSESYLQTLKGGFGYFIRSGPLVLLCLLSVGVNVVMAPANQLMPAFVADTLKLSAVGLSVVSVASSAGMLLGSVLYPLLGAKLKVRKNLLYCGLGIVIGYGAMIGVSFASGMEMLKYVALFAGMGIIALGIAFFSLMSNVLFFRSVEESYLSRMASIFNAMGMAAVPIGSLYCGTLVSNTSIPRVFAITIGLIVVGIAMLLRLKTMRELERINEESKQQEEKSDEVQLSADI